MNVRVVGVCSAAVRALYQHFKGRTALTLTVGAVATSILSILLTRWFIQRTNSSDQSLPEALVGKKSLELKSQTETEPDGATDIHSQTQIESPSECDTKSQSVKPVEVENTDTAVGSTYGSETITPNEIIAQSELEPVVSNTPIMAASAQHFTDKLKDDHGLFFNDQGKLVDPNGDSFQFDVYAGDHSKNQRRYEEIGELMTPIVYELLEKKLKKVYLREDGTGTFIFVSEGYDSCEKLLVLIHGTGVVRAGQWARRLIINDSLKSGTQLPYIKRAMKNGWGVLVMNTNDRHYVEGSRNPSEHGKYVWQNFISWEKKIKKIAIVAHSAGGGVTTDILRDNVDDFKKRVFAVAFTDAFGSPPRSAEKYFKKVARNWVTSGQQIGSVISRGGGDMTCLSAGTTKHEETSHYAIDEVFKFIEARLEDEKPASGDGAKAKSKKGNAKQAPKSEFKSGGVDTGEGTVDTGKGTVDTGKGTVDTGEGTVDTGEGTVDAGEGTDDTGKGTADTGEGTVDTGEGTVDTGKGTVYTGKGTDDTGKGTADTGKGTVDTGEGTVDTGKGTVDTGKGTVDTGEGTDDTGKGTVDTGKGTVDTGEGTVDIGKGTVDTGEGTDDTGKGTGDTGEGTDDTGKGTVDTGEGTVDTGEGTVDTGKGTVDTEERVRGNAEENTGSSQGEEPRTGRIDNTGDDNSGNEQERADDANEPMDCSEPLNSFRSAETSPTDGSGQSNDPNRDIVGVHQSNK